MQPRPPESQPPVSTGRAAPPPRSRLVAPLKPPVEVPTVEPARRPIGKILGTIATTLLVLATLGVIFKIIVRPVPEPTSAAASDSAPPAPLPNDAASAPVAPGVTASPGTGPAAMPVGDLPGWHQTFADDFTGNLRDKWYTYDGQPGGDPGGWFSSSHVGESAGLLTIGAWKEKTPHGTLYASGGMSNAKVFSQVYGLYKIRFRIDKGWGIAYTIQLWPTDNSWPPEIDILEDNGRDRQMTSMTLHYGASNTMIHREIQGDWTGWHVAEVQWSPGSLVYRLDGKVWASVQGSYVPSTPMSIAIQSQAFNCGHTWDACPNSTTPARVNLQVDWVVAYQAA